MVPLRGAAVLVLLCAGAAGDAAPTATELRSEVEDLRQEMAELHALLARQDRERRLQAVNYVTKAAFDEQVVVSRAELAATKVAAEKVGADVVTGDLELQAALSSAWLLLCGTLVMFMHAGFAMLETGCCRAKNASNVLMKNLINLCVGTLAWYFFGWGFAYGGPYETEGDREGKLSNGFIGTRQFFGTGFTTSSETTGNLSAYEGDPATSSMLAWYFQWAFCTAAATIVSGGVCERVRSVPYAAYSFIMAGFIYPVVVAWTWGYGFLSEMADVGFMDFAGSGVVHLTGGVSALAGTIVLGPRKGRFERPEEFEGHSLPLVVLGTLCLWFGWYGFNCGSTLGMADSATGAMAAQVAMNTSLSAAAGGITAFVLRYVITRLYDVGALCNGILAGLVSITAGCGNVEAFSAVVIGMVGAIVYVASSMLQQRLRIDDPVDASSVHGAAGIWGVLACVLFDWGEGFDHYHGWSGFKCMSQDGKCQDGIWGKAMLAQVALIAAVVVWAGGMSALSFYALMKTGLLRVDEETEELGMDLRHHSPSKAYAIGN